MPKKTVSIESRYSSDILHSIEVEDTGDTRRNLGLAVLALLAKCAKLQGADLRCANLRCANLQGADLRCADLRCVNLQGADLRCADLQGADLQGAQLQDADLQGAQLRNAQLQGAQLQGAQLRNAQLQGAQLRNADLQGADLQYAQLQGADLQGAQLQGAQNIPASAIARTRILAAGSLIGWKKVFTEKGAECVAKLRIPEDAKRSHAFGRKCRAEYAEVLEIRRISDKRKVANAHSSHDPSFWYKVRETVRPVRGFSENWMSECESGIHFFITEIEAAEYN